MHGRRPASPWQLSEDKTLADAGQLHRGALHQCRRGKLRQAQPTGFLTDELPAKGTFKIGWPKVDAAGEYQGPLRDACGCRRSHQSGIRLGASFQTPPPALSRAAITWLAELLHYPCSRSWLKLGLPEEREKDIAELLPDFISYDIDSDGYGTDGTVFHDPIFPKQEEDTFNNTSSPAGAGVGDFGELIGKDGFKDHFKGKNLGSKVQVQRIPMRHGATNGRWGMTRTCTCSLCTSSPASRGGQRTLEKSRVTPASGLLAPAEAGRLSRTYPPQRGDKRVMLPPTTGEGGRVPPSRLWHRKGAYGFRGRGLRRRTPGVLVKSRDR